MRQGGRNPLARPKFLDGRVFSRKPAMQQITLDIPPGGGSVPHRHPGHHTFGYVLEGTYKIKVDNAPEETLTKGQTFYEPPGALHAVSRNGSDTQPAKVLVVMLAESGKPTTVPERP